MYWYVDMPIYSGSPIIFDRMPISVSEYKRHYGAKYAYFFIKRDKTKMWRADYLPEQMIHNLIEYKYYKIAEYIMDLYV